MRVTAVVLLLASIFAYRSGRTFQNSILFSPNLPAVHAGPFDTCHVVKQPGMVACEDAVIWSAGGQEHKIILGCDSGRWEWNTVMGPLKNPEPKGGLFLYTPSKGAEQIQFVDFPENHDFHPLGLDIHSSGQDSHLYVVNHARYKTYIEHFIISSSSPTRAKWARTIDSPHFKSANSIALTSPNSFYVSNDHTLNRRLPKPFGHVLPLVETLLSLPLGWVSYVTLHPYKDPASFIHPVASEVVVARGISFANGISLSEDGQTLAVSATSINGIHFYAVNTTTHQLTYTDSAEVPFSPDNIRFDSEGRLVVAGHSDFPALIKVAKGIQGAKAPSWAVSLKRREVQPEVKTAPGSVPRVGAQGEINPEALVSGSTRAKWELENLFQSNGSTFGCSSTGLRDGNKLYVTGLYEDGLLVCT